MNKSKMFLLTASLSATLIGCGGSTTDKVKDKTVDKAKDKVEDTTEKAKEKVVGDDKKSNKCVVKDGKVTLTTTVCMYSSPGLNGGQEIGYYCDENGAAKNTIGVTAGDSILLNGIKLTCKK